MAVAFEPVRLRAPVLLRKTPVEAFAVTLAACVTSTRPPAPVPIEPLVEVKLSCEAPIVPKLPLTMLFFALKSTVPVPAFAFSEPAKLIPAPDELRITLPLVALIDEPPLEPRVPLASALKLPEAVRLEPVKLSAPVLVRKTPVAALAVTLATCDTSRRETVLVPIEPVVEVRFN